MSESTPVLLILRVRAYKKEIILPQRIDFVYPILNSYNIYNIKFFDIQPYRPLGYYLGYLLAFILSIPKLIFVQYDYVFIENPYLSFFAPIITFRRKKLIVEFVDYYPANLRRLHRQRRFRYFIAILIAKFFHRFYSKILTESLTTKKTLTLLGIPDKKLKIVPVAIDTKKFTLNKKSREKIRFDYDIGDSFVLGYLGKLVDYYNLSILPEIVYTLNKDQDLKNIKFKLMIIGDGPYKAPLENKVIQLKLKNVIFTGAIQYELIEHYYSGLDLFIFPLDSIAIKIGEVLSMGIPIVVQKGMAEDWITDKKNGLIVNGKNADDFVQGIKKFINLDDDSKSQMRRSERNFAINNLDKQRIAKKYLQILTSL
ncbi:MAG: glycosyltransferase [Candidatus Hodarchaeales archaeon]|jgi:glycosyltransferase involved in cell wall biosynthesis